MDKFMPSAMYSIYLILLSLVVLSLLVLVINLKKKKTSPQTYPYEPFPLRTRVFRNASQTLPKKISTQEIFMNW